MAEKLIRRGEVYWVDLSLPSEEEKEKGIIHELQGTHPAVIISNNQQNLYSPLIIIIPITSDMEKLYSWEVVIHSEGKERKILTDQIRSVDKERIREHKGKVSYETLTKIENNRLA